MIFKCDGRYCSVCASHWRISGKAGFSTSMPQEELPLLWIKEPPVSLCQAESKLNDNKTNLKSDTSVYGTFFGVSCRPEVSFMYLQLLSGSEVVCNVAKGCYCWIRRRPPVAINGQRYSGVTRGEIGVIKQESNLCSWLFSSLGVMDPWPKPNRDRHQSLYTISWAFSFSSPPLIMQDTTAGRDNVCQASLARTHLPGALSCANACIRTWPKSSSMALPVHKRASNESSICGVFEPTCPKSCLFIRYH